MELIMQERLQLLVQVYTLSCLKPKGKLAQYGKRIFNLEGTDDEIAKEAINKTVEFFHTMGMDTKLSDYTKEYNTADFIVKRFDERG
jgi:NADP-dependent alcohol dehydrogenase